MKSLRMWCAVLATIGLAGTAQAWRASGWVYTDWPWAYESTSEDWHWFSAGDTQWVHAFSPGSGWARLQQSSLAHGWSFWDGAWAYDAESGAWCWLNTADTQWVVNMRTGAWGRFGEQQVPDGMVLISGGTNAGTDPDFGAYSLTVSSFCVDKYEVTQAQWDAVYIWAIANGYDFDNAGSGKAANHPVHTVNWYDVVKWCNARSQKERRAAVYTVGGTLYKSGQADDVVQTSAVGYRLPTEVEWEYAARGGIMNRRFPWGDEDNIQHVRANYHSSSDSSYDTSPTRGYYPTYATGGYPYTSPVGSFAPNGYGLYDMAGNVHEFCYNWCLGHVGSYRVGRGGGWIYDAYSCQVGVGDSHGPGVADIGIGFRAVLPSDSSINVKDFSLWQLPGQTRTQINSYVIRTTGNDLIIIDGGTKGDAAYLREFIRDKGNHVHAWFISHPHFDHVDALTAILNSSEGIRIDAIYGSIPDEDWMMKHQDSEAFDTLQKLKDAVEQANQKILELSLGQKIRFQGATFEILAILNPELTVNAINNQSAVWRVDGGGKSVLFLGDLGVEGGIKLLTSAYRHRLKADYVQMSHHGQNGVSEEFYEIVNPKFLLWPTPDWLWENDSGNGRNSGPWKTLEVRAWMEKLGIERHYIAKDGLHRIDF